MALRNSNWFFPIPLESDVIQSVLQPKLSLLAEISLTSQMLLELIFTVLLNSGTKMAFATLGAWVDQDFT